MLLILPIKILVYIISNYLILWRNIVIFKNIILFINLNITWCFIYHLTLLVLCILIIHVFNLFNLINNVHFLPIIFCLCLIFTFKNLIDCHFRFQTLNFWSLLCHSIDRISFLNFILNKQVSFRIVVYEGSARLLWYIMSVFHWVLKLLRCCNN